MPAGSRPTLLVRHEGSFRLRTEDVIDVARNRVQVRLHEDTRLLLERRREEIVSFVRESGTPHYGFNRAFGHNQRLEVSPEATRSLQLNLLRSHASGVGEPAPKEAIRAAMLLRAVSLARGHSGARPELVERLLAMLNEDVVPVVPRFGSVGASGDLAPLSHLALTLVGEGTVEWRGAVHPTARVLARLGWRPLLLEMKEGLALNNGVQFTAGLGFLLLERTRILVESAALLTALSTQVLLGADTPFRPDVHELRPHPGARLVAGWVWQLMSGSPIRAFHRETDVDSEVQDPYSLRCAAQILGAAAELVEDARRTLEIEANAVTDNPVILPLGPRSSARFDWGGTPAEHRERALDERHTIDVVSGGHFHGMPLAFRLYGLVQAMAVIGALSNTRAQRYVDEDRNRGLGADLKWPGLSEGERATSSALMIPEYVSAALTNWIWGASMPSHLFSIATDAGQEDHVSMSAGIALRAFETLPRVAEVLAVELAMASQAASIRRVQPALPSRARGGDEIPWGEADRLLSPACEAVLEKVREVFPTVTADRSLSEGLSALAALLLSGELSEVAGAVLDCGDESRGQVFPGWGAPSAG